jgi:LuxR family maltose regulon positive regulatory protein
VSSSVFTLTKIQPPRARRGLIARQALEARLEDALASRRLTLLSAPAGFGKTAALTRQLERLDKGTAVAWIAADEDDDLHRLLGCLFAALEPFDLPWRADPDALIAAAGNKGAERRIAAIEVLNALAGSEVERGLVVIDDAHRIGDAAVFDFIDSLLERLPAHWGFVIASRIDPPLALARLRARDELAEFRQQDLRFEREEIAALVAASGGAADAGELLQRTAGWAAGLRLVLNEAHGQSSSRRVDRHVFEYLAAEVLDEMPSELREFLLRCSVLAELTASRCAAVSGNPRAAQLLDEIERRGLFVSVVDAPEPTLKLHDLFRDCLDERLKAEQPEFVPELLRRAATTEPDAIRRLSLLLRANAWEEAEVVLEQVARDLVANGAVEPALRLIEQFPAERRASSPVLTLVRGEVLWAQWDWRGAAEAIGRAKVGFGEAGDLARKRRAQVFEAVALVGNGFIGESTEMLAKLPLDDAELETRSLGMALHVWHAIDSGDFGAVAPRYSRLLDVLEETDRLQLWYQCFQRPLYVWLPGMRAPLSRFVDGVMRRNGDAPSLMRSIAFVMAAWLALWRGDLGKAAEHVAQAEDDARWLGMPVRLRMFINTVRAAVSALRAEREPAILALETLLGYFASAPVSGPHERPTSMRAHYLLYAARIADALGDADALRAFAAQLPPLQDIKNLPMLRAPLATVPARLAAAAGRHDEALGIWREVLRDEPALDVLGLAQEARARYAWSLLAAGRHAEAASAVRPLFAAVGETGEVAGVLLAGPAALGALAQAAWRGSLEWSEIEMLRNWAQLLRAPASAANSSAAPGSHLLSSRELEVLGRIAAGDSNKVIARTLDLSPHTVKRHVANILDKLGAGSRGEAAQWFRARC